MLSMHETVKSGDWSYKLYDLSTPPETFPVHAGILELWRSKRVGGKLPDWRDFDFMEFREWWGWLTVLDVVSLSPVDGMYRLWGTNVVQVTGTDMTGKRLADYEGEIPDASSYIDADLELFEHVGVNKVLGYQYGPVNVELISYNWLYILRMPLAADGENVDKILSADFATESPVSLD